MTNLLLLLILPFFAGLALAQSPDPTGGPHKVGLILLFYMISQLDASVSGS